MRLLLCLLCLLHAAPAAAAELRGLRLSEEGTRTRVEFDLDARAAHKVFTLSAPDRVVVDLMGVSESGRRLVDRALAAGVVGKLRSGPRADGALRIVFEVSRPAKPRTFVLPPSEQHGYRLMLDLDAVAPRLEPLLSTDAYAGQPAPTVAAAPAGEALRPLVLMSAQPAPSAPPSLGKPIVIAVDAGHGGDDPGAIGRTGLYEKAVALSIARKLAAQINAQPGYKAVLTRDGDYFIDLRERVVKARKAEAELFVSIHANAYKNASLRGSAVYVLSSRGASSEHARWLAQKENSADLVGGIDLHDKDEELAAVLIDLSQASTMEASFDLGSRVLASMGRVNTLQKKEVQQAGFMVLKAPDIPSILVETAFITNEKDEKLLGSSKQQEVLARAIMDGVKGYFRNYRPQQQFARTPPPQLTEVRYQEPRSAHSVR